MCKGRIILFWLSVRGKPCVLRSAVHAVPVPTLHYKTHSRHALPISGHPEPSFRQQGYEMKMCTPANVPEGYKFHNNDGYYLFSKGSDPIVISVDDYFKMEASILEFTEFVTSKYLKKEGKA